MRSIIDHVIILLATCLINSAAASAQIITTFAGIGAGFSGDGGPATAARLTFPSGIATDTSGNLYIVDRGNNRIRKVDNAGIITTVAGTGVCCGWSGDGGPATAAQLNGAEDVATDIFGNILIPDYFNNRVRKIDPSGIITTVAGNGVLGNSGDGGPATAASIGAFTVAADKLGNIYIGGGPILRKVDPSGMITTIAGSSTGGFSGDGGPATAALFTKIEDICLDTFGNIYIVDQLNYRIRKINTSGIITTIAGTGTVGFSGDGGPATAAQLNALVYAVEADVAGNVYIADHLNNRVRKINSLGIITTIAGDGTSASGGDGGPATAAQFVRVFGIARHKAGNLYVADRNGANVRMILDSNHAPHFAGGHSLHFNVCTASASIDSVLSVADLDTAQVEFWHLVSAPTHGTVSAGYVTYTTGGTLTPTGLTYTPLPGYVGYDTFKVRVTDSFTSDTTTVYVRVDTSLPFAGAITGTDSVCIGDTILLHDTTAGGTWSMAGSHATVLLGSVIGATTGADTVRYIVTNACGNNTALRRVYVKNCPSATPPVVFPAATLQVSPNPGNGAFTILLSAPASEEVLFTITNVTGQVIATLTTLTNTPTPLLLHAPAGIYIIHAVHPTCVRQVK